MRLTQIYVRMQHMQFRGTQTHTHIHIYIRQAGDSRQQAAIKIDIIQFMSIACDKPDG